MNRSKRTSQVTAKERWTTADNTLLIMTTLSTDVLFGTHRVPVNFPSFPWISRTKSVRICYFGGEDVLCSEGLVKIGGKTAENSEKVSKSRASNGKINRCQPTPRPISLTVVH